MNTELLNKYISGNATEVEKQHVTEWIQKKPENMREYMTLRKLHDIVLWRTKNITEKNKPLNKRFTLRMLWVEIAKISAIFAILFLGTYYWIEKNTVQSDSFQSIHVPAGQRAEVILSDGTKVWLNSKSTLTYPLDFDKNSRNVKLDGEGYFMVTKNKKQAFIVETNKHNIKVLGTEFNVIAYSTDSIWEIALLKGAVEIVSQCSSTINGMKLEPNTMVSLRKNILIKEEIKEVDHFLWREGLICFNNVPIKEMFEKLKRYYDINIIVNNTEILENRYTSKFRIRDGIEHVLKVLQLNTKFTYQKDDEKNTITID